MKSLYLDLGLGASGDMLTSALLELFDEREEIVEELNNMGIPQVEFVMEETERGGIKGTHMSVRINGEEEDGEQRKILL